MSTLFMAGAAKIDGALLPVKAKEDDAHFDITAMIDLVFMMNIFFMVTALTAALAEIALPEAEHCLPADADGAVVVTMVGTADGDPLVYLADGERGAPLDETQQARDIPAAIEQAIAAGHNTVIIKAEHNVRHKDVAHVARIASESDQVKLHLAVRETSR
ncbi:MAG TPA: biopolymer transporter ExbD [Pirellulales bacterium]|nr:biopolymer transporter ExbD [Pirellulales bacterium]